MRFMFFAWFLFFRAKRFGIKQRTPYWYRYVLIVFLEHEMPDAEGQRRWRAAADMLFGPALYPAVYDKMRRRRMAVWASSTLEKSAINDRLRRFGLIIDLRLSMREWGDTPKFIRRHLERAETCPLPDLEQMASHWRGVIEARRKRQPSEASV